MPDARPHILDRWRLGRVLARGPEARFQHDPGPRGLGRVSRGQQLTAGEFLFSGVMVQAPEATIWDLPIPAEDIADEIHGFAWLEDLAAAGHGRAAGRAT